MESKKIVNNNFFRKVWYSITKFEKYPDMALEGVKKAIKYLIILIAFVTVFVMIDSLIQMKTLIGDFAKYIQDNIPQFTYTQGNLSVESEDTIIIDDIQYEGIDKIVINTLSETSEQKDQIEKDNLINGTTIFLFRDEIILKNQSEDTQTIRQSYLYNDFIVNYTKENIEQFNKEEFVQCLTSEKMTSFYIQYGVTIFVYLLLKNIMLGLVEALEIAILGYITTTITRIKIKFVAIYNMAIYSLTLPMLLNILYIISNYFIQFRITYFQVAYITIAYIYLATAIFILKDDFIKKMQEVEKIKQEQIKVREEIKQDEQNKKEEKEDDKQDDKEQDEGDEPQGSGA